VEEQFPGCVPERTEANFSCKRLFPVTVILFHLEKDKSKKRSKEKAEKKIISTAGEGEVI